MATGASSDGRPQDARLRAVCDLRVPAARERGGWHGYDGVVQDLSPAGVREGMRRLREGGERRGDGHDERALTAAEAAEETRFGVLQHHRWNPHLHLSNLDLGVYARPYAPEEERREARRRHVAAWPDAVDAAIESLDAVPARVAEALLPSARGLAEGLSSDEGAALRAHARLLDHLEALAEASEAPLPLGGSGLAAVLGAPEALDVDLGALVERARAEQRRLQGLLAEACERLSPGKAVGDVVATLTSEHPTAAGMLEEGRALTAESIEFVTSQGLLDDIDGECRVAPSPPGRRWATAALVWAAPYEPDGPSWYYLTPPDEAWDPAQQRSWLEAFSPTTLPATTVHEVAPGHYAHGRYLRRARSDVRATLQSPAFVEGWAHYGEELCVDHGYRADDPRFAVGVALKALLRVARLHVAIGVHTGGLDEREASAFFTEVAYLPEQVAVAESRRASFDPTYGRYTWGKLVLRDLAEQARSRWGANFTDRRFHDALLSLGAPPLALAASALEPRG